MIIYKTTNTINNKIYIGKAIHNNPKYLGSGLLLNRAIKKYGREMFVREVIDTAETLQQLNEKQKHWIKETNSNLRQLGYNIAVGGFGGDTTTFNPNRQEIINKRAKYLRQNVYKTQEFSDAIKAGKTGTYTVSEKCHKQKSEQHKRAASNGIKSWWVVNRQRLLQSSKQGGETRRKYDKIVKVCPICQKEFQTITSPTKEKVFCSHTCANRYLATTRIKKLRKAKRS